MTSTAMIWWYDYSQQPVPALSEVDAAWVDTLLQEKGLR